ncbi:hypothetical protein ACFWNN_15565 [Lentzea sp. NPDC058450]|uniref:hypothetical protein n=1 Tax=Lentzea sp. NPDC058450 TaxID=3346505 RepID=UPI003655B819
MRSVNSGTPFGHAAAGAGIWYLALVVGYGVWSFRTGAGFDRLVPVLATGFVLWSLTSVIMWALARRVRIKPWVLIFLSAAIYFVLSQVLMLIAAAIGVAFVIMGF